ncbi:hypothetical protein NQ314_010867 [Rhamnusium bicolor]|uniref:Uncharacterized protein n=1 Tax=Rhamnusium bicolor TaxID=1586634 RepID=A0AAV8XNP6_9CUCU|nr:hypothetical protein NQ314_010867 [Rhamnusium bicolor]
MSLEELTKEQKEFLEECNLEFSERFTDSDLEYKKIYESGIPPPPIMCPWYLRNRYNRDRAGSSQYNDHHRNNDRLRNRDYREENYRTPASSSGNYNQDGNRRYRPY